MGQGKELPLNRNEAILLLKELESVCGSFLDALSVSIEKGEEEDSWELRINCAPSPSEVKCIEEVLTKHSYEMAKVNWNYVFRSKK